MDPSIVKLLEEDEDETMHSGADVEAFTAALNRDIEGDNASTSQPPTITDTSGALSQGTSHTPSQLFQQWQSSKREEEIKPQTQEQQSSAMEISRYGHGLESQHPSNDASREVSQLDKDRAMQLQALYIRLRSNNINKEEFVRHMRSLVGDHMLKMAVYKLQQGQVPAKPSGLPMDNNAQKQRLLEHQSDSHGVHKSSNVNAIQQERDQPFPMQGLGKQHQQQQHMPFPQSSFTNYGNTAGNYSSPNMNMPSQSFKEQVHDLQMRQGPAQNAFYDMKRLHVGSLHRFELPPLPHIEVLLIKEIFEALMIKE